MTPTARAICHRAADLIDQGRAEKWGGDLYFIEDTIILAALKSGHTYREWRKAIQAFRETMDFVDCFETVDWYREPGRTPAQIAFWLRSV